MAERRLCRTSPFSSGTLPEFILHCVFEHIDMPEDRGAVSLVCREWYYVERWTRRKLTITCCYAISPSRLTQRFPALQELKIKGKPRASMFGLVPDDWGGYAGPWISEISVNCKCLYALHLRRMVVIDEDLSTLAEERGDMLQILRLDRCSGFSTTGLQVITKSCRNLRQFSVEESYVREINGDWLKELYRHNTALQSLNISGTNLKHVCLDDLSSLAANSKSLVSLKLNELELGDLSETLRGTTALEELGGVCIDLRMDMELRDNINLPNTLTSLVALFYAGVGQGDDIINSIVQPIAPRLRRLDLQLSCLTVEGHCRLLMHCANLQALEVFDDVGDDGLHIIAQTCRNLRRLRVQRGDKELQQGFITQRGLISIAFNCHMLECIAACVSNINNAALSTIAFNCPNLRDFRLVLVDEANEDSEYPLDDGIRDLIIARPKLRRLALCVLEGFLTDQGMKEIGIYGKNLEWVLLGLTGDSDEGIKLFANGCSSLKKLEIRDCVFSEAAITASVLNMAALKYVWVEGYRNTDTGRDLLPLTQNFWRVELINKPNGPAQFFAYRSLAEKRTDLRSSVRILG
ncbi:hypothetical protein KP509_23G035800 [Ceratopteris richardii]|uniref:F-box domain-containing protein n=1 Tax=Ceratopteris richardii TaxID=49495 RepID=A0A8T2S1W5_CERRI|nr:hypothetical protein KP509_23G035800 [Ceratopteris richardii]